MNARYEFHMLHSLEELNTTAAGYACLVWPWEEKIIMMMSLLYGELSAVAWPWLDYKEHKVTWCVCCLNKAHTDYPNNWSDDSFIETVEIDIGRVGQNQRCSSKPEGIWSLGINWWCVKQCLERLKFTILCGTEIAFDIAFSFTFTWSCLYWCRWMWDTSSVAGIMQTKRNLMCAIATHHDNIIPLMGLING